MIFGRIILSLSVLFFTAIGQAEHPLTNIRGTQIDLKTSDHAIAGSIRDFVIFGHNDESQFTSDLTMKRNGQLITARFGKMSDGKIGGVISEKTEDGVRETRVEFVKVVGSERKLIMKVNNEEMIVQITADAFEDNHFKNPEYSTEFRGEKVSFKMENGQACFSYSLHLAFMIFGAYFH